MATGKTRRKKSVKPTKQDLAFARLVANGARKIDAFRQMELLHRLTSYVRENHESGRDAAFLAGAKLLAQIAGYEAPQKVETAVRVEMSEKSEKEVLLIAGIDTQKRK